MAIGVGAGDLGGDLGAIDRRGHDAEGMMQDPHVEAAVMEELHDVRVGEQAFEIGSARLAGVDLHDVGAAVAARNLDDAEPVPPDNEPQRLRVDRRRLAKGRIGRQIVAVEANHRRRSARSRSNTRG